MLYKGKVESPELLHSVTVKNPEGEGGGRGGRLKSRASVFTYPIKTKLDGKMLMVIPTNL